MSHQLIGSRDLAVDDFRPGSGVLPRGIRVEDFTFGLRQHDGNGHVGLGVFDEASGPFAGPIVVSAELKFYWAVL